MSKMSSLFLILFLLLVCISMAATKISAEETKFYPEGNYGQGSLKSYQCGSECVRRCGQTQYHKSCMFFCQKCCKKCLCVPPGYYGNKQLCPCYNNWKTKRGGPKCP